MNDNRSNIYQLKSSTAFDAKPAGERRWLEIWKQAAAGPRGEPRLSKKRREHFAYHLAPLKRRYEQAGKSFDKAMLEAAERSRDVEQRRRRGLPFREGRADTKLSVRADHFVVTSSGSTDRLYGAASKWLFLVEVLAEGIGADYQHEVYKFWHADPPPAPSAGVMGQYEKIFTDLADKLSAIATDVARRFEVSSYYECCDRMGAYMRAGAITEDDGWGIHFERHAFDTGSWAGDFYDPLGSGDVPDMLIHVLLGRPDLGGVVVDDDYIVFEVAIFLGLASAQDKLEESPCLLVSPRLRRWSAGKEIESWSNVSVQDVTARLMGKAHSRFQNCIQELAPHLDGFKCEPLTGATCMKWLSLGQPPGHDLLDTPLWEEFPGTVSAPVGTLAAYIQSNLAYADKAGRPELRLDRLLEAEARDKIEQMRALLASKSAEYRAALRLAFPNDHSKPHDGDTDV